MFFFVKYLQRSIKRNNLNVKKLGQVGTFLTAATGFSALTVTNVNNEDFLSTTQGAGRFLR